MIEEKKTRESIVDALHRWMPMVGNNSKNNDDLMSATQVRRFLKIKEAATLLKVCQKTIRRWDEAGKITCYRTQGGHRRIPMSEIIRLRSWRSKLPVGELDLPLKDMTSKDIVNLQDQDQESDSKEEPDNQHEQKAGDLPRLRPPLRHDLNVIKTQLKLLRYLLASSFNSQKDILVLTDLITIIRDTTRSGNVPVPLRQDIMEFWGKAMLHLQELEDDRIEQQQSVPTNPPAPKKWAVAKDFQTARENASEVFLRMIKAANDARLDPKERTRASEIIANILRPYQQLTRYLIDYPEGVLEHDVIKLLLTAHPSDLGMQKNRWSVRTLARACRQLGTKSCSKSQVGRFYKKIKWHRSIKKELISPDPKFGEKMKAIGNAIASLKETDCLLYGDEFRFTSSKVAQRLEQDHAPVGLEHALSNTSRACYSPVCSIHVTGIFNPNNGHLDTTEIPDLKFESVARGILKLCEGVLDKIEGKIVLILDNASNHSSSLLRPFLKKYLGDRIELYYLPTYSPNNNPIEGVWNFLLNSITRLCSTKLALRTGFSQAVQAFKNKSCKVHGKQYAFSCPICRARFFFLDEQGVHGIESLDKHLCFNMPGLTPYTIDILTHSLEVIS